MDYEAFYEEMPKWIGQVNQMALQYTMENIEFWNWVSRSLGEMANRYGNNPLVLRQLTMMFLWLEDVYVTMKQTQQ